MTVSPQVSRAQYDIPGGAVSMPALFAAAAEELTVWIGKGDVHRQLHAGEWSFDGTTLTTAAGPGILSLVRRVPLRQPMRYRNGAPIYPVVLEGALDRATRQIQDLATEIERSLRLHPTIAGPMPAMEQPVPHGIMILDEAGAIRFDPLIKDRVLTARDETVAASTRAVHEAAEAQTSQVMAAASFFFRNEAEGFAARAIAAQAIVQAAAERAS